MDGSRQPSAANQTSDDLKASAKRIKDEPLWLGQVHNTGKSHVRRSQGFDEARQIDPEERLGTRPVARCRRAACRTRIARGAARVSLHRFEESAISAFEHGWGSLADLKKGTTLMKIQAVLANFRHVIVLGSTTLPIRRSLS